MTYAAEYRWWAISLMHENGFDVKFISDIFGPKPRTIFRWYRLFLDKGVVEDDKPPTKSAR